MADPVAIEPVRLSERAARFEGRDYGSTVSFFVTAHPPGSGAKLHRHPYEETFIVQEGVSTFTVGDATVEAPAGQIVVVPAGAAHKFTNSGEGLLRLVGIHPSDHVVQEELEE
jgi:mannose-6-phosphate isomerase-like protein (cupin superfamily)